MVSPLSTFSAIVKTDFKTDSWLEAVHVLGYSSKPTKVSLSSNGRLNLLCHQLPREATGVLPVFKIVVALVSTLNTVKVDNTTSL